MSIGNLNLAPVPVLTDEAYEPPKERSPIPEDGEYILRLPEVFPEDAFEEDKRMGEEPPFPLGVVIEPKIISDADGNPTPFDGTTLRFQRASTRWLQYRKSSTLADLLMALGLDPRDMEGMSGEDAMSYIQDNIAGQEFTAYVRWESSFFPTQGAKRVYLRGMRQHDAKALRTKYNVQFEDGVEGPQARFPSPWEMDQGEQDQPKLIFANARIGRYVMPD